MLSLERYRGVVGDEVIESLKQEAPENRTSMCLLTLYPYPTNSAWPQSAWKHCPNPLPDLLPTTVPFAVPVTTETQPEFPPLHALRQK